MVELGGDVRALLAQARLVAQKNGAVTVTSGHVVLAMLESSDETGRLLEKHGARHAALYEALKAVDGEASNALDLMQDAARRIATKTSAARAQTHHLLLAAVQSTRSEAHRGLVALGVRVDALQGALEQQVGLPRKPASKSIGDRARAERAEALTPLPRTLIDWEAQKRQGERPPPAPNVRLARPREKLREPDATHKLE
ncbi:MAG: Clp protease N-terminal domain-containing protein, partial [Polyangiales bacterium]